MSRELTSAIRFFEAAISADFQVGDKVVVVKLVSGVRRVDRNPKTVASITPKVVVLDDGSKWSAKNGTAFGVGGVLGSKIGVPWIEKVGA